MNDPSFSVPELSPGQAGDSVVFESGPSLCNPLFNSPFQRTLKTLPANKISQLTRDESISLADRFSMKLLVLTKSLNSL